MKHIADFHFGDVVPKMIRIVTMDGDIVHGFVQKSIFQPPSNIGHGNTY